MDTINKYIALMKEQGNRLYTIRILDVHGNCKRKLSKFLRPCDVEERAQELCSAYGGHSFELIEEEEEN